MGTLFDHQEIVSLAKNDLRAAAEVPGRGAAVTVEADIQRRTVVLMNISAAETEPVVGADRDRLIRQLPHGCDHRLDGRATRVSFWDDSDGEIVILRSVRRIKTETVDPETASEKQQKKNKQHKKNGHEITPEKQKRWLAGNRIAQTARFFKACGDESA